MMLLTNNSPKYFACDKVAAAVAELQAGDPDWTYVAVNADGSKGPYASIRIYDEDGEFVAFFGDG